MMYYVYYNEKNNSFKIADENMYFICEGDFNKIKSYIKNNDIIILDEDTISSNNHFKYVNYNELVDYCKEHYIEYPYIYFINKGKRYPVSRIDVLNSIVFYTNSKDEEKPIFVCNHEIKDFIIDTSIK